MIRTSTLLIALLISAELLAQGQRKQKFKNQDTKNRRQDEFLQKQWWIGLKGGLNLTEAVPGQRYSVLSGTTNYPVGQLDKVYEGFGKAGSQASVEITFYMKGFSFSFQPTYRHSSFTYSNQFEWEDTSNPNYHLILNYKQENKVDYLDLPLIVKYDLTKTKLRPYVQAGVFYSSIINATKSVTVEGTDVASGGTNTFSNEPLIVGATDLYYKGYWGLIGGAGADYNLGNVRLVLDVTYRMGMSNVTNTTNRFSNDRLNGIGDAMDDMKLNNIVISVGCLFPMRFLGTGFKTLDR
ncbi:MAG: PorT family protein [Cyclobacteriaceae bacterium]|nr:PorT family protein [Cyclobacteriaceae bacterium]